MERLICVLGKSFVLNLHKSYNGLSEIILFTAIFKSGSKSSGRPGPCGRGSCIAPQIRRKRANLGQPRSQIRWQMSACTGRPRQGAPSSANSIFACRKNYRKNWRILSCARRRGQNSPKLHRRNNRIWCSPTWPVGDPASSGRTRARWGTACKSCCSCLWVCKNHSYPDIIIQPKGAVSCSAPSILYLNTMHC